MKALSSMLKKAASGVLGPLSTFGLTDLPLFAAFALTYFLRTLRAPTDLWPCRTGFFEHPALQRYGLTVACYVD